MAGGTRTEKIRGKHPGLMCPPLYHCQCSRDKVPPRPQGQRSEPTTSNPFSGFGFGGGQGGGGGGFHMSFGIGAFPFTFFASNFNFGEERPGAPNQGSHQATEEAFLHKVFLWVSHFQRRRSQKCKKIILFRLHLHSSFGYLLHSTWRIGFRHWRLKLAQEEKSL